MATKRSPSPPPPSKHVVDQHITKYTRSPSPPSLPPLVGAPTHACPAPDCSAIFPTAHFLDLHLSERHDPLVAARQARGEKTFRCFDPACEKITIDPAKRRRHLIDKHGYPKDFEFRVVVDGSRGLQSWLRHGPGGSMVGTHGKRGDNKRGRGERGGGRGSRAAHQRAKEGATTGRSWGRGGRGTLTLPVRTAPGEKASDARGGVKSTGEATAGSSAAKTKDAHGKNKSTGSDDDEGSSEEGDDDDSNDDDDSDDDDSDEEDDDDDDSEEEKEGGAKQHVKTRGKSPDVDELAHTMATTLRFVPRSVVGRRPLQEKERAKK